ncbi:hypothetical protein KFK09_021779 [Dendrobium nobile]|uniref:Cyclin-like domain-containing protein n=1 Tax=Dendrobium nobile TaxID=94219 RepID=A0A8T3AH43_DENNO|nr:hypothetical protein KFK09_021779 [Dendrobium nobile]
MAGYATVDSSHHGVGQNGPQVGCSEEPHDYGARWYFTRKEIEEYSPSRRDGIDLKKETYLRKSYCTFLRELGMRLKVPQVTIATAIIFCHRFFLRQSHAKNDRMTIATVCMFLAGKVEETPRPLKDVILVSYEIIHKKGPFAAQEIKHKEVYEQQKELILLGERLVLATLGFDLNVHHPYRSLVDAIRLFNVAQSSLAKVAWNFVNDGLRTSLCLQFKPMHIAAGAMFLASKFIKVKLPSDGEKAWWQVFDVTPRQLEDVSNQLLELYEQNQATQQSHCNETNGSSFAGINHHLTGTTTSTVSESSPSVNNASRGQPAPPMRAIRIQQSNPDTKRLSSLNTQNHRHGHGSSADGKTGGVRDQSADCNGKVGSYRETELISGRWESSTAEDLNSSKHDRGSAAEVISAVEKAQKLQNDHAKKNDLIEKQVEDGIELDMEDEEMTRVKRRIWPKPLLHRVEKPAPANMRRRQCKEDGNPTSIDEHNYSSRKFNVKLSGGMKRKPDEKRWSDHSSRDCKRVR